MRRYYSVGCLVTSAVKYKRYNLWSACNVVWSCRTRVQCNVCMSVWRQMCEHFNPPPSVTFHLVILGPCWCCSYPAWSSPVYLLVSLIASELFLTWLLTLLLTALLPRYSKTWYTSYELIYMHMRDFVVTTVGYELFHEISQIDPGTIFSVNLIISKHEKINLGAWIWKTSVCPRGSQLYGGIAKRTSKSAYHLVRRRT